MRSFLVLAVASLSSCVTTPPPKEAPEPPGICETHPDLAATRKPKPAGYPNCSSQPVREGYKLACLKEDLQSCHLLALCLIADGAHKPAPEMKEYMDLARGFLQTACRGGIAESCTLRAGAGVDSGMAQKDTCEDLTRAAQLGEGSAQLSCLGSCQN